MSMTLVVDVVSDVICPWCYIGKRRLERAFEMAAGQHNFTVAWRPFQLNPAMPAEGMDRAAYLAAKFGDANGARDSYRRIETLGAELGIPFRFDRIRRTPNTLDSHRLIRFGQRAGRQQEIVEALFEAYFTGGVDLGDRNSLIEIAEGAGCDPHAVEPYLATDEDRAAVIADDESARRMGIDGVPSFIFNRALLLPGAADPEMLLAAFDQVAQDQPEPPRMAQVGRA
jgi:predicted DsbA family dithiol-disulfide isomerase